MQKKINRFYTFNLPQIFNKKNKISSFKVSKNLFHSLALVSILAVVFASVGFVRNSAFAEINANTAIVTESIVVKSDNQIENNRPAADYRTISYDRPAESEVDISYDGEAAGYTFNAAAPPSSATSLSTGNSQLETQIQTVIKTSNPQFLPTVWAHFGKINNEFGFRRNPFGGGASEFHAGLDIDGEMGNPIIAPGNGVVVKAEWSGGYGNMIEIDHGNGLTTRYGHLSRIGITAGSTVQRGQFMGMVGSTGRSTGPHLHFEVRLNDKPVNPRRFLQSAPTEIARLNAR